MKTEGKAVDSVIQYQLHREASGDDGEPEILIVDVVDYQPSATPSTKALNKYYALTSSFNEINEAIHEGKLVVFRNKILLWL